MRFEALKRDCNTRVGNLEIGEKKIKIPNVLWYESERIPSPLFAELKLGKDFKKGGTFFYPEECKFCIPPALIYPYLFPKEIHEKSFVLSEKFFDFFSIASPKWNLKKAFIYIMANAKELFSNPRNFVNAVVDIRKKIGYRLLYAPGIATPINFPILCYCGIDIFDSLYVILKTRENVYFTSEREYKLDEIEEYPCSCKWCKKEIKSYEDLLMHNYESMKNEIVKTRNAIYKNELREYVESRSHFDAKFASIIRIMDTDCFDYQEKRFPLVGNKIIASPYSLKRPDINRFRERIRERYKKPECTKILLLLPCSAKKPYSLSKSHKIFKRVISNCINRYVIHEVIVTSPIGIVPRELEYTYPSAHYDISVTGHWSREEMEMVEEILDDFISKNNYEYVINHLPPEISDKIDIDAVKTCIEHPISRKSLEKLKDEIKIAEEFENVKHTVRKKDDAKSILLYQFGEIAEKFMEGCSVKGKYPEYKIYYLEKQVASFSSKRGLFSLTLVGGKKLGRNYWVEIDDFIPKGSIFAVGIKNADERIRIGDEVVVYCRGELRGVGISKMNGEEMVEADAGEAIKIRHHI
ncbi:MAG TPA: hypothetical protein ENI52_03730 [Thermoplasmata archaeon]|nr:hypothetical protein [Thermoplasmata archaeon]